MVPKWNRGKKKNGMTLRHSLFIFGSGHVHFQIVLSFRSSFVLFVCLHPVFTSATVFQVGVASTVHRESFIMGWKLWGEGSAALRKPSERSSGWQHHLLGKTGKTEEGNKERKQHESLIIRHKHQQWNSKKIGNVSLNWTLNSHL